MTDKTSLDKSKFLERRSSNRKRLSKQDIVNAFNDSSDEDLDLMKDKEDKKLHLILGSESDSDGEFTIISSQVEESDSDISDTEKRKKKNRNYIHTKIYKKILNCTCRISS